MGIIPHPPIFLSHIRVNDVWLLLAVGTLYEVGCRLFLLMSRMKSHSLRRKEAELSLLQMETDQKRKLGPQAFVETSKLERQVLARELELQKIYANRKTYVHVEKRKKMRASEPVKRENLALILSSLVGFMFLLCSWFLPDV
jgi:hypothetical protein